MKIWRSFFYLCLLFLSCEGEGAEPRVAADICCLFLLRETQPGVNLLLNPACVLLTPLVPPSQERMRLPQNCWLGTGFFGHNCWWSRVAAVSDPLVSQFY